MSEAAHEDPRTPGLRIVWWQGVKLKGDLLLADERLELGVEPFDSVPGRLFDIVTLLAGLSRGDARPFRALALSIASDVNYGADKSIRTRKSVDYLALDAALKILEEGMAGRRSVDATCADAAQMLLGVYDCSPVKPRAITVSP